MVLVKGVATMHSAGVVPQQRIPWLPRVLVHITRLDRPLKQIIKHGSTVCGFPADDFCSHTRTQIECFFSCNWVGSNNRVRNVRRPLLLFPVSYTHLTLPTILLV